MKKILALILIVALCIPALFSCKKENPLDDVTKMYNQSAPTKVVATTTHKIGSYQLNGSYEIVTGMVDGAPASVYTTVIEELRTVEEGAATEDILEMIKKTTRITESIEGQGSRVKSVVDDGTWTIGKWNPNGTVWTIGRGTMGLNLDADAIANMVYENNKLTFTIPEGNAATVLDEFGQWTYSEDIVGEVSVTIVDDGAVINSIELHYFLKGDGENLENSEMTVKVEYIYDINEITIQD